MQLGIPSLYLILLLFIPIPLSTAKITLFTNTYPPFSDCSSFDNNSSHVIGAEIELLRLGFSHLNWTEGIDFEFNCTAETSMAINSSTLDSQYQALVGGITITADRLKQQTPFSQPTVSAPLDIIYRKENKGWFFVRSFQTSGWFITLATVLLIGGILYLLENRKIALINMIYCACCEFFMVPDYPIEHASGKVLQFFSSFLVLVLVAVFTATSANIFQTERDLAETLCLADLKYQQVYTNSVFSDYLKQFGIDPIIIDDEDPVRFAHEIDKFPNNHFILDGPYGNYVADQNCELYVAENSGHIVHYGIMYNELFPETLKNQINRAIILAKKQKSFKKFVGEYYSTINNFTPCKHKFQSKEEYITFYELRGLWYLLFSGLGIGIIVMVLQQLRIRVNKNYRVYSLQGIRAKIDRKVQRRTATLFAIHTGISIQCITFLKNLNQEVLQSICQVAMKAMDLKAIREQADNNAKQEPLQNSNAELPFEAKGGFGSRAAAAISWIRGGSRKKSNIETLQVSSNKKGSNDSSPRTPGSVARSRKSSMLRQTMYNFKLNSELMQKVQNLALSSERNALNSPEADLSMNDKPLSSSRSGQGHISLQVELNKSEDNSTVAERDKSVSMMNRLIGKKGIKQNKQMTEAAKTLLEKKESALLEEFKRKEKDISIHLKFFNRSHRPRPLSVEPLTPKSRNGTLYPSTFKLKMLGDQSPIQKKSRKKLRNFSSPETSLLKSVFTKPYEAAVAASGSEDQRPDQSESKFKILLNLQEISEFSSLGSGEKRSPEDNSIEFFEESPKFRMRAAAVKSGEDSSEAESPNEYQGDESPIHHLSLSPYLFSNKYEASN